MKKIALALIVISLGTAAWASGSSRGTRPPARPSGAEAPFKTVETIKLTVLSVQPETRMLNVRHERSGVEQLIQMDEGIAIRARKKSKFDGRKELEFADFATGQTILVTIQLDSQQITKVRVL